MPDTGDEVSAARATLAKFPNTERGLCAHLALLGARVDATDRWLTAHNLTRMNERGLCALGWRTSQKGGIYFARADFTAERIRKMHDRIFSPEKRGAYNAPGLVLEITPARYSSKGESVSATTPTPAEATKTLSFDTTEGAPAIGAVFYDGIPSQRSAFVALAYGRRWRCEDGLSFGFMKNDLWIQEVFVRDATPAEIDDLEAKNRAREEKREAEALEAERAAEALEGERKRWFETVENFKIAHELIELYGLTFPGLALETVATWRAGSRSLEFRAGNSPNGRPIGTTYLVDGFHDGGDWRNYTLASKEDAKELVFGWAMRSGISPGYAREWLVKHGECEGAQNYRFLLEIYADGSERGEAYRALIDANERAAETRGAWRSQLFGILENRPPLGWRLEEAKAIARSAAEAEASGQDAEKLGASKSAAHNLRDALRIANFSSSVVWASLPGYAPAVLLEKVLEGARLAIESCPARRLARVEITEQFLGTGRGGFAPLRLYANELGDLMVVRRGTPSETHLLALRERFPLADFETEPVSVATIHEAREIIARGVPEEWEVSALALEKHQFSRIVSACAMAAGLHGPVYKPARAALDLAREISEEVPQEVGETLTIDTSERSVSFTVGRGNYRVRIDVREDGRITFSKNGSKQLHKYLTEKFGA